MSNSARDQILARLRSALQNAPLTVPEVAALPVAELGQDEKIEKLKTLLEAMHAEVYLTRAQDWLATLQTVLRPKQVKTLLYAPATAMGAAVQSAWSTEAEGLPALIPYRDEVESCKDMLFAVEASITSTRGGIAESGALILWPDDQEPRLMSLAPAIHIAVLDSRKIYVNLAEVMRIECWQDGMPTNVVLISGPSKTADIELTLTFGVHGPRELIVLMLRD